MGNETATAQNPNEASAKAAEASATLVTQVATETDKQTPATETQTPPATEKPTTETGATEKPAEEAGKEKTATAAKNAPEKYEFKAPDGKEYDSQLLEAFTGAAKDADLSQEVAQKLIDKMGPAMAARQVDQIEALHKEWTDAATADAEFGGEKLKENLGVARKALDTFGTPELRKLLDTTGMGNNPEVIRLLFRAGKALSEEKFVGGNVRGTTAANPTAVLYDKTSKG